MLVYALIFGMLASVLGLAWLTVRHIRNFGRSPRELANYLVPKLWITYGLGGAFLLAFYLIVLFLRRIAEGGAFTEFLHWGLRNPMYLVNWAAIFVICNALMVCVVRLFVKFAYLSRYR